MLGFAVTPSFFPAAGKHSCILGRTFVSRQLTQSALKDHSRDEGSAAFFAITPSAHKISTCVSESLSRCLVISSTSPTSLSELHPRGKTSVIPHWPRVSQRPDGTIGLTEAQSGLAVLHHGTKRPRDRVRQGKGNSSWFRQNRGKVAITAVPSLALLLMFALHPGTHFSMFSGRACPALAKCDLTPQRDLPNTNPTATTNAARSRVFQTGI